MDHEFDLAFALLDEAAERIQYQQYGITHIVAHDHGPILLSTVHEYTPGQGHHLVLLATDDYGQMVAIEATAPDLETAPATRIRKVRAGDLTFHEVPGTWSYRAHDGAHTYTLSAGVGDEPMWTLTVDGATTSSYEDIQEAIDTVYHREPVAA